MEAPTGVIDSHLHLWSLASPFHQWPGPDLAAIHRDFGVGELATLSPRLAGVVLVQAQPDARETEWLLNIAETQSLVLGVVGWTMFDAPDAADAVARLARRNKLVGLRPMLQDMADQRWILGSGPGKAIAAMVEHGLCFDALVRPRHLPAIRELALRWPDLRIVIDHGAKPAMSSRMLDPWRADMAVLAELPNVWCKLSGLLTELPCNSPATMIAPHVRHLVELFGARLMWGSDWPVLTLASCNYAEWMSLSAELVHEIGVADTRSVYISAVQRFYGLPSLNASLVIEAG